MKRWASAISAVAILLAVAPAGASDWQSTLFPRKDQTKTIHYRARSMDRSGQPHSVEAWRDKERLRRSSDGILDLYATRSLDGLSTVLVDKRAGRVVRGDEGALLRAGHIEAWSELAYVLVRPAGSFELVKGGRPKRVSGTVCQPYRVVRGDGRAFTFCWSARLRLPLEITDPQGRQAFVVESVEERRPPAGVFVPPAPAVTDRTDDD